jgi:hypothetical protein
MTQPIRRLAHLQTGTVDLHVQHVEGRAARGGKSLECTVVDLLRS